MENKSCKSCGLFSINNQHCYGKCKDFSLWQPITLSEKEDSISIAGMATGANCLQTPIVETSSEMIEITIGGITSHIDPKNQPALQDYINKECLKRVEIDEDILGMEIMGCLDRLPSETVKEEWTGIHYQTVGKQMASDILKRIKGTNPLKLKQQGE